MKKNALALFVALTAFCANMTAQTTGAARSNGTPASFVLGDGKLGPLSLGQTVASLPSSVPGLYDRYEYKKQEVESDMEDSWIEEWCFFYKGGREVFKAHAEDQTLDSFVLEEGSSFIKTSEGFYVGCSARTVFSRKRLQWETWYTGTTFARNGHWEYHIPAEDILGGKETPTRLADIKQSAKISMIAYYSSLPE